jgi:hypothetical protein
MSVAPALQNVFGPQIILPICSLQTAFGLQNGFCRSFASCLRKQLSSTNRLVDEAQICKKGPPICSLQTPLELVELCQKKGAFRHAV